MAQKQLNDEFAAVRARQPTPERLTKALREQTKRFKQNPEEKKAFMIRAGVMTRKGSLARPYREAIRKANSIPSAE